jgi:hypothetical protein
VQDTAVAVFDLAQTGSYRAIWKGFEILTALFSAVEQAAFHQSDAAAVDRIPVPSARRSGVIAVRDRRRSCDCLPHSPLDEYRSIKCIVPAGPWRLECDL